MHFKNVLEKRNVTPVTPGRVTNICFHLPKMLFNNFIHVDTLRPMGLLLIKYDCVYINTIVASHLKRKTIPFLYTGCHRWKSSASTNNTYMEMIGPGACALKCEHSSYIAVNVSYLFIIFKIA